nr:type I polyketide synthase [Enhygromyxa salina]
MQTPFEPLALIGIACRFPGDANDPRQFWERLRMGHDAVAMPGPQRRPSLGGGAIEPAGYLRDIAGFDPQSFNISPAEARELDPQQRLLLELGWELFEDAGIRPQAMAGTRTGVFVGAMWSEYAELVARSEIGPHTGLGSDPSILSARLAHHWDLRGPALTVQTASSSSLMAVHLACQSVWRGESDVAIAGGVSLIVSSRSTTIMQAAGTQSPHGRSRAFDVRADGYVRGEGAALILLVPLREAVDRRLPTYCVLHSTAANQDGRSESLTRPSLAAQFKVLRAAQIGAGLGPNDITYIEAHGTGTALGDATELAALAAVFGDPGREQRPLRVGSLKPSIGHLEAASGIAGLVKAALSLERGVLPPTLHCEQPSSAIVGELEIQRGLEPWPQGHPRYAGVSAFGWGGTNVHVILGAAPEGPAPACGAGDEPERPHMFVLSARDPRALEARARAVLEHLTVEGQAPALTDLCHTAGSLRTHHEYRLAHVASTPDQLRAQLEVELGELNQRSSAAARETGPVFVFAGSGGDWAGMGRELLSKQPTFGVAWRRCDEVLRPLLGASLVDRLTEASGAPMPPSLAQPAVFCLQVALAELWRSWGIEAGVAVGHSFGEIAAAHVAGALSLEDAAKVVVARGQLIDEVMGAGATALIGLPPDQLGGELEARPELSIAGHNDPRTTLISGRSASVDELVHALASQGVFCRRIEMPFAGHSSMMDPLRDRLRAALAGIRPQPTHTPLVSTVTGEAIAGETLDAEYWVRNLRDQVRFAAAISGLSSAGHQIFVELSARPLLSSSIRACARAVDRRCVVVASLRGDGSSESTVMLEGLGQLYRAGYEPTFSAIEPSGRAVRLPSYPWTRAPYWREGGDRSRGAAGPEQAKPAIEPTRGGPRSRAGQPELSARIRSLIGELLGLGASELSDSRPLRDYGLDSLLRMELRARLGRDLGIELPVSFAVDHPTVAAMVEALRATTPVAVEVNTPISALDPVSVASDDAIAIVGVSCRLPGADDIDEFWQLLMAGRDAMVEVPPARWSLADWYDEDPRAEGKMYMREGGFLRQDPREFDAGFFDISSREARSLDPQQRLLLEVGWEALEDAGVPPTCLRGSETGVFVGVSTHEYGQRHIDSGSAEQLDAYSLTGNSPSVASGRLAFALGLEGPVMSVDTACSSALTALHLACKSLRDRECELALAGAVDLLLSPVYAMYWCRVKMLSPSNRSRSFDAAADGFAKGEGCVVVALKRLSDARRDGDTIRAVIRGSAVVHDGRAGGLTVPSGRAQVRALRRALRDAGVEAGALSYIEGHGTGGAVADAIEVEALGQVLAETRGTDDPPIHLGSVKANIGHLGASGGLAGVVKLVCALEHAMLPPQPNFGEPSPHVPWQRLPFVVPREPTTWRPVAGTRLASVSSIGLGGTTATLILEQAPTYTAVPPAGAGGAHLFMLSGRTESALRALAGRCADAAALRDPGVTLDDLVHSSARGRDHLGERAVVVTRSREHLREALRDLAEQRSRPEVLRGRADIAPKIVFVFTGVGSQWPGMGLDLLGREGEFRRAFEQCEQVFRAHGIASLSDELRAAGGRKRFDSIEIAQPTIFSIEVALVALWRSWGVEPEVVVGHSMGEFAAAHTAGILTLEQAAEVLVHRGELLATAAGGGTMAVVGLSGDEVRDLLGDTAPARCCVATTNGPKTTVVAGVHEAIEGLMSALEERGVFCRKLEVEAAYHSPQMNGLYDELVGRMPDLRPAPGRLAMYSTLDADWAEGSRLDIHYWARNMRDEVRFADAMQSLMGEGPAVMLEIGPNPDLRWAMNECLQRAGTEQVTILPSMRRDQPAQGVLATSLAALHVCGASFDFDAVIPRGRRVALPHYPWQRRRYWLEAPRPAAASGLVPTQPDHAPGDEIVPTIRHANLREAWRAWPNGEKHQRLRDALRDHVVLQLALGSDDELGPHTSFAALGMDSFMAMSLADQLGRELELELSSTLVYDCPDLERLFDFLRGRLESETATSPIAPRPALASVPQRPRVSSSRSDETIAVIGAGCRLPGGVVDLDSLWQLLDEGRDAITQIPTSRFDLERWYDPELARPGSMYTREAGLLDDVRGFDAAFFGISPREAVAMDPQHRLTLEVSWEALEHAGIRPSELDGSLAGVFLGICSNDYSRRHIDAGVPERVDAFSRMGIAYSVAAGRVAYALGLRGPAVAIDTACSSSLVAIHNACASLRSAECELALAGGVNVLLKPEVFASLCKLDVLSRSGRVRAFSAAADGYVRAEGCAMVVLKPLSAAERDGDRVLGLIRGSAVGHNGRSNGLSAPSRDAQAQVIRAALDRAGIEPDQLDYVEAHGTGTRLGDAIELQALHTVFGERDTELPVGSLKTNMGHLEASAGVAGVLKVISAMQHDSIPKQLHFDQPSPNIDWRTPLRVVATPHRWARTEGRLAGVSSFGANGTNAHLVLEQGRAIADAEVAAPGPYLLVLSARSALALEQLAAAYKARLASDQHARLADVCFTAACRRDHHQHRLACIANDAAGMYAALAGDPGSQVPRSQDEAWAALEQLAARYRGGEQIDFGPLYGQRGHVVDLPRYPWQHLDHWLEQPDSGSLQARTTDANHPLLRERSDLGLAPRTWVWSVEIDAARQPYLHGHRFRGLPVATGAIHIELALAAASRVLGGSASWVGDVELPQALLVPERGPRLLRFVLSELVGEDSTTRCAFQTLELDRHGAGTLLAKGEIRGPENQRTPATTLDLEALRQACNESWQPERVYAELAIRGFDFGPAFRRIERLWLGEGQAIAELSLPIELGTNASAHVLHPAFLDACTHVMLPLLPNNAHYLGLGFKALVIRTLPRPGTSTWAITRLRESADASSHRADLTLVDAAGQELLQVRGLCFKALAQVTRGPEGPASVPSHEIVTAAQLEARIRDAVRRVGNFPADHPLSRDQPLAELGFDSLMIVELLAELESEFGRRPRDLVPSVASLCAALQPT